MDSTSRQRSGPLPAAVRADHRDSRSWLRPYDYPFLLAATASFLGSVTLWFLVNHDYGVFVGLWVPSILALWNGIKLSIEREA